MRLGFIGLGVMGRPTAEHLLADGAHQLDALTILGRRCEHAASLAKAAEARSPGPIEAAA